jgi:hypothetical protein
MSIQEVRSVDNPQKNYEFEVEIVGSIAGGSVQYLKDRVQTATIPETSVETFVINHKGGKTTHAGRDGSPKTVNVTYFDDEGNGMYAFHKNWMDNGILNETTGAGQTRDQYQAEMYIRRFAADSETVTQKHRITKLFPTTINEGTLNYEGSEVAIVEVTYSFDECNLVAND